MEGFANPFGLTVDTADNVWVADVGNGGLVSKFDPFPSENKIGEQSGGGQWGGTYNESIAVGSANGNLYVADSGPVVVDIFNSLGEFTKQVKHNFGGGYDFVAVDNSGGAADGRMYVASTNGLLQAFDASGEPLGFSGSAGYINGNEITGTPGGSFGRPQNIATDVNGNIYVVDQGARLIDEFAPSGIFIRSFDGSGAPGGFSSTLAGVAIDPINEDVLVVDQGNQVVDEFESSGTFVEQLTGTGPSKENPFGTLNGGIAVSSGGYVYVAEGSTGVDIFGPNALLPKVTYGAVTNQTQTAGTLNASVDLNGGPKVTACSFQYGTTAGYGKTAPCSPSPPYEGTTAVSTELSGLTTEATYHYRIVLTTANGVKKAPDQTYIPHAVAGLTTKPATEVLRNTATLNGTFNGDGEETSYYFEWGTSEAYGHTTPVLEAGTGLGPQDEPFELGGLQVETTYHYRFVGHNNAGTSYGGDQFFKTQAAVVELSTDPVAELTATSATLKGSYTGIGEEVHYFFEWGPTPSYGHATALEPAGSGSGHQGLNAPLSDLLINREYHYRVVADDVAGTTFGADRSFTTLGRYEFSAIFGSAGSGDGQLSHPADVGVDDSTGDIYVADKGNHRIVKLSSSGSFLAAWGWGVSDGSATRQVCASSCQAGIAGFGAGQYTSPEYIEVDNSGGPSDGDVYVADGGDSVVQKLDPSGNLVGSWGNGGAIDFSADGAIGGIASDIAGNLYVVTKNTPYFWSEVSEDGLSKTKFPTTGVEEVNFLGTPGGGGIEISPVGAFYETQPVGDSSGVRYSSPESSIYSNFAIYGSQAAGQANSGIVIDRSTGDIYVDQGGYIDQFESLKSCDAQNGCVPSDTFGSGDLNQAAGLGFRASSGMLYAANTGGNDIVAFAPLPLPSVETGTATNRTSTSGTITGHVDPAGPGQISDCHFEYGTDISYSLGSLPCSPSAPFSAGSDVSAELSGLTPFTTYHYRLVATRADGKNLPRFGRDRSFTPAPLEKPSVTAGQATDVTPTTATLGAEVNPNMLPTVFRFRYGNGGSPDVQTYPSDPIGEDGVPHPVSTELTNLVPGTTYTFSVIATNLNGSTLGPEQTFTTPDFPAIGGVSALSVTADAATLTATIRPGFSATTTHFEYGLTAGYGSSTPASSIGPGGDPVSVSNALADLAPLTVYHYRVVATNAVGTVASDDQTFATGALPVHETTPPGVEKCKRGFVKKQGHCVRRHKKHRKTNHKNGSRR